MSFKIFSYVWPCVMGEYVCQGQWTQTCGIFLVWHVLQKCHRSARRGGGGNETIQRNDEQGLNHGKTLLRDLIGSSPGEDERQ